MPKLALLTAIGGPIELAEFPAARLADVNEAFASADAGSVPRGALVP